MSAPLSGVRVLDLTRLLPGPMCTLHLADLGADVVKIEDRGEGDYARGLGVPDGAPAGTVSAFYRMLNRNKRSVALDLKLDAGKAAFLRLAARADVVCESFRPGTVDRLGIGYATIAELNPRLVYCAITGYGQTGPWRERAGHDINYLATAGVLDQTGIAGGAPALSNVQIADLLGGAATAAMTLLAALYDAQRSGTGHYVDVAMADGALANNVFALHALEMRGEPARRGEDLLTGGVPCYAVYATSDGRHMAVGALEAKFWRELCRALDRDDLVECQFATGERGTAARAALASIFEKRPQAQWVAHFAGRDCCVDAVLTLDETLRHPQFGARAMVVEAKDGGRQYAPPYKMSGHAFAIERGAPEHGEHTREVLEQGGFSTAEIGALATAGAIA
ncbi:MAG: CaiB/BaiF CoA-transferase family protein [Betaproteobacteria bacterium]